MHQLTDRGEEQRLRQRRHRQPLGGFAEAARIGVGAEQRGTAVGRAIGLEAFENLLRIMKHGAGRIELDRAARLDTRIVPAPALRIADDRHVIGEHLAETRIGEERGAIGLRHRIAMRLELEVQDRRVFHCTFPASARRLSPDRLAVD